MSENIQIHDEEIAGRIFIMRGQKVMLDSDLAELYGVETRRLNEQVKRNIARFPEDFMFQLTENEVEILMSQIATSSSWGGRRKLPYVFTEHGAVMLASVLKSERAVRASVAVVRVFVKMRRMFDAYRELENRLADLELRSEDQFHQQQEQIAMIFEAIKQLMVEESEPMERIGFRIGEGNEE